MEGDEAGGMNHSYKFPPMIVDISNPESSAKLGLVLKEKVGMFSIPFLKMGWRTFPPFLISRSLGND